MGEEDQQYTRATKAVVDDAMRTDVLGPNVCKVLTEHVPTNELIEQKVAKLIQESPKVRDALGNFNKDDSTMRRGRMIERVISAVVGAAGLALLELAIKKFGQ